MEELGRFADTSPYRGQAIDYGQGRFTIRGSGDVDVRTLVQMDDRGEISWRDDGVRRWVFERAAAASVPPPATSSQPSPSPTPAKSTSPAMIAVIIIAIVAVLGACGTGILFLLESDEDTPVTGPNQYEAYDTCEIGVFAAIAQSQYLGTKYQGVFVADTPEPYGTRVATSDTIFEITLEEYTDNHMSQTPEREAAVQELANTLIASGWKQIGSGAEWYSLQFGR